MGLIRGLDGKLVPPARFSQRREWDFWGGLPSGLEIFTAGTAAATYTDNTTAPAAAVLTTTASSSTCGIRTTETFNASALVGIELEVKGLKITNPSGASVRCYISMSSDGTTSSTRGWRVRRFGGTTQADIEELDGDSTPTTALPFYLFSEDKMNFRFLWLPAARELVIFEDDTIVAVHTFTDEAVGVVVPSIISAGTSANENAVSLHGMAVTLWHN